VACATTESSLAARKSFTLLRSFPCPMLSIHHTELASLLGSRSTKALLGHGWSKGLRTVVLGHSIRKNVIGKLPDLQGKMISITHPYLFPASTVSSAPVDGRPVFGFLGLASMAKGFDLFVRLAEDITVERPELGGSFRLVGRLSNEFEKMSPQV